MNKEVVTYKGVLNAFVTKKKIDPKDIALALGYNRVSAIMRYIENDDRHTPRLPLIFTAARLAKGEHSFDFGALKIKAFVEEQEDVESLCKGIVASALQDGDWQRKRLKNLATWMEIGRKAGVIQTIAYKGWAEWGSIDIIPYVMEATGMQEISVTSGNSYVKISLE